MKFALAVLLLVTGWTAHAKNNSQAHTKPKSLSKAQQLKILNYDDLVKLDVEKRSEYIKGIRALLVDIAEKQNQEKMVYSTESDTTAGLIIKIFAEVMADWKPGQKCIFAGHISETYEKIDAQGNKKIVCKLPNIQGYQCENKNELPCRTAVFGYGKDKKPICVAIDKDATKNCSEKAQSPIDYANYLEHMDQWLPPLNLKADWEKYTNELKSVCKSNQEQRSICNLAIARIEEIHKKLNLLQANPSTVSPLSNELYCTGKVDKSLAFGEVYPPMGTEIMARVERVNADDPKSAVKKLRLYSLTPKGNWVLLTESLVEGNSNYDFKFKIDTNKTGLSEKDSGFKLGRNCQATIRPGVPTCNLSHDGGSSPAYTGLSQYKGPVGTANCEGNSNYGNANPSTVDHE